MVATYLPEPYYFNDQPNFPFERALLVTAKTVGAWADGYKAEILAAKRGSGGGWQKGELGKTVAERRQAIGDLVQWLTDSSEPRSYFDLRLTSKRQPSIIDRPEMFEYQGVVSSWYLALSPERFEKLQKAWRHHGLPDDLFYREGLETCVVDDLPPRGFMSIVVFVLMLFGRDLEIKRCYSPKRWEVARSRGEV